MGKRVKKGKVMNKIRPVNRSNVEKDQKRIRENAANRLKGAGVDDIIPQVLVPFEIVTDMKKGKKRKLLLSNPHNEFSLQQVTLAKLSRVAFLKVT